MPAYNFQTKFVPMILDGSKPHTIRRRRKRPTKVGDMLWLCTGMRTKEYLWIASAPCVMLEPIEIIIKLNNRRIVSPRTILHKGEDRQFWKIWNVQEIHELATRDGFVNIPEFFEFFKRYKQEVLEDFEIIWWDPKQLDINPVALKALAPIALAGTSPKSSADLGEEDKPGVCSLGYDMRK